jgi:hypothetical protein
MHASVAVASEISENEFMLMIMMMMMIMVMMMISHLRHESMEGNSKKEASKVGS